MIGRNDSCWCGSGKKWKRCHYPDPGQALTQETLVKRYWKQYQIILKDDKQIEGMRRSGKLAAEILQACADFAKEGVTTKEIDDYSRKLHEDAGAIPASLNYGHPPFPGTLCTSLNEVICHGIPNDTPLKSGDIMNVDVACILNGYYGDNSRMVMIGDVDPEKKLVCDVSYECLMRSIDILKPGVRVHEIGDVIEDYAASQGCSVVNQFVGHGVGVRFHENPQIPHHRNDVGIELVAGMTFTIEPMINAGAREGVIDESNHWEARTIDGKPSAQWEHTLLITDDGYEILTPWTR